MAVSAVTSAELGHVSGVTSAIQTQLNGKQATLTNPVTGTGTGNQIAYYTGSTSLASLSTSTYPSLNELSRVKGVTSNIQTQLNDKQATITGAATTIVSSDLTASMALVSDTSGKVAASAVTSTELGYVSGVTSAIQTQLGTTVKTSGNQTIAGTKTFSSTISGSITGNAGSATKLQTARTIGGVSFDGTADIDLPGVNTSGTQDTSGNAGTVTNGVYTNTDQPITGLKTFTDLSLLNSGKTGKIRLSSVNTEDTLERTLSIKTNNANRNLTISGDAVLSGTNSGDQTITLTGDVTGTGTGSFATTLANSGVTSGTYTSASITVDAKGRITSASSNTIPSIPNISVTDSGTGAFVTDVTSSGHTITLSRGNFTETGLSLGTQGTGDFITGISVSNHQISYTKGNETHLSLSTTGSGNAITSLSVSDHAITATKGTTFLTAQSNDFGTFAINGTDSGYTWGTVNTNTNQTADTLSDTLTFVKGGGINLYTNTVAGTDAIKIEHADTSNQASLTASARKYITALTLDIYGHVTGLSTGTETVVDTNDIDYINSASFSTSDGILTLSGVGNAGATVDLDGRYAYSSHSHSYLPLSGGTLTGPLTMTDSGDPIYVNRIGGRGTEIFIGAGEALGSMTGTDEAVYIAGEGGVRVYASSDNLTSGLNRSAVLIDTAGNASWGSGTITAGTFSGNATSATTATKLGTSTVGSTQLPIYLNAGTATAITKENLRIGLFGSTAIGSASQPIYLAANGVPTAITGAIGNNTTGTAANVTGTVAVANGGTGNTSVDTTPTASSTKMVTSGGVYNALANKQNTLTNPVTRTGTVTNKYLSYFTGASTITGDASLQFDLATKALTVGSAAVN